MGGAFVRLFARMKTAKQIWRLGYLIVIILSACSKVDNILPDREAEYQQSKELPPLEIPPDLTSSTIDDPSIQLPDISGDASFTEYVERKSSESDGSDSPSKKTAKLISIDNSPYIDIDEDFPKAWRMVGKAVSNLGLEVTDRDRTKGDYYVLFNGESTEKKDEGLLASLAFWRDIKVSEHGEKFLVRLEKAGQVTKVVVLDSDQQRQTQGLGLELLRRIEEKLNGK